MFCKNCGTQLRDGAAFCPNCGTKVTIVIVSKPTQLPQGEQTTNHSKKTSRNKLIAGVLVGVFAVCAITGAVVLFQNRDKETITDRQENPEPVIVAEETEAQENAENSREPESQAEESESKQEADNHDLENTDMYEPLENADLEENSPIESDMTFADTPQITMEAIADITASSYLVEQAGTHEPSYVTDGTLSNAWVEGASGQGIGEWIAFSFDDTYNISGIQIYAGYHKNENLYYKNSRPMDISLVFSDGSQLSFTLDDWYDLQTLYFPQEIITDSVTLYIESVYPGSKYEDTVISEIQFF